MFYIWMIRNFLLYHFWKCKQYDNLEHMTNITYLNGVDTETILTNKFIQYYVRGEYNNLVINNFDIEKFNHNEYKNNYLEKTIFFNLMDNLFENKIEPFDKQQFNDELLIDIDINFEDVLVDEIEVEDNFDLEFDDLHANLTENHENTILLRNFDFDIPYELLYENKKTKILTEKRKNKIEKYNYILNRLKNKNNLFEIIPVFAFF